MRPLRLRVNGLTCFKEPQDLDLSALELFAITGPTGAGKSTLLDAIVLALYGKVPRLGAQNLDQLIAHGRDRFAVVLDFRIGDRIFRVTRTRRRRAGSAQALLEELVDGTERPIADRVTDVDDVVARLLGLSYEAFTRAVILPQGEFMRFLKSRAGEQRELLAGLLRHHVYERMRQRAAERTSGLEERVTQLERQLAEDFADVTPEALTGAEERHAELEAALGVAREEVGQARVALESLRALHAKTAELATRHAEIATLEARAPEIDRLAERVDAARRAAPVIALLDVASNDATRASELRRDAENAIATRDRAREANDAANAALASAEQDASECATLRERIRQLDEVRGRVEARNQTRTRLTKLKGEKQRFAGDAEKAERAVRDAHMRVEASLRKAGEAAEQVAAIGYDAAAAARLDDIRDAAVSLRGLRTSLASATRNLTGAVGRAEMSTAALARREAEAAKAEREHAVAERALASLHAALHEAQQKSAAALLRRDLAAGAPCPVCDQTVVTLPPALEAPEVDELTTRSDAAARAERRARQAVEAARIARESARTLDENERAAVVAAKAEVDRIETEIASCGESLRAGAGDAITRDEAVLVEERVLAEVDRLAGLRRRHDQAVKTHTNADRELATARGDLELAQQRLSGALQHVAQTSTAIGDVEAEVARLDADIALVTQDPDPVAERRRLAAREAKLTEALQRSRDTATARARELAVAEAQREACERAAMAASRAADDSRTRADTAARAAGFADEAAVRAAALDVGAIEKLAREVGQFREHRHAEERRAEELTRELAGREVDEATVREAEANVEARDRGCTTMEREKAQLELEISRLRERLGRAAAIRRDLAVARTDRRIAAQLAEDLKSANFQAFVLEETFRELAAGASERLRALSGRYTLEYRDRTFAVIDHDNAGERRSADTLSGGETFLASLALALELSAQVQRAAGAVSLDSLFVDEGFGTLDAGTLDAAASAIESLPVAGRMVGIVTHVPELAERLPARVVVDKRGDGSRVSIETA